MPSEQADAACLLVAKLPVDTTETCLRVGLLTVLDGVHRVEQGAIGGLRRVFAGETTASRLLERYADLAEEGDALLVVVFAPWRRIDILAFMLEAGCEQFLLWSNGRCG